MILPAQNQLSPLVKQSNVPLFEHIKGATTTEFTLFLKRVLTEQLPFDSAFSDAVYVETSGHPYLTVNMMVDFCDWMIEKNYSANRTALEASDFQSFVTDRLNVESLKRSSHYKFFVNMLGQYASEQGRRDEPWLSVITRVLQEIARKRPGNFTCTANIFQDLAEPLASSIHMTVGALETSGKVSNFLESKDGHIKPGVRLMARLAAATKLPIN
jgi:hypothetical protein